MCCTNEHTVFLKSVYLPPWRDLKYRAQLVYNSHQEGKLNPTTATLILSSRKTGNNTTTFWGTHLRSLANYPLSSWDPFGDRHWIQSSSWIQNNARVTRECNILDARAHAFLVRNYAEWRRTLGSKMARSLAAIYPSSSVSLENAVNFLKV